MPSKLQVREEILHLVFYARHTLEEDFAAIAAAARRMEKEGSSGLILDLSESREERTWHEIFSLAKSLRELFGERSCCCAVLVSDHLHFGLARMLAGFAESENLSIRVFKEEDRALEWLRTEKVLQEGSPGTEGSRGRWSG